MVALLANTLQVTSPTGDHVVISPVAPMLLTALYLLILMIPVVIVQLFFIYKKKLQHLQILAAMEKGLPVTDLLAAPPVKETGWIANVSAGIGLLFVAAALLVLYAPAGVYVSDDLSRSALVVIPIVLIGLAITRLIRGLYMKKQGSAEKGSSMNFE